ASALGKLLLALAILLVAVFAPGLRLLAAAHALTWVLVLTSRLPARLVVAAAGYPLVFAALFIASQWDGTWQTPARLSLRPLTSSLAAVWLVGRAFSSTEAPARSGSASPWRAICGATTTRSARPPTSA
ncbi:MAG TPA: hypothetical protein VLT84_11610, partial [Acidobacteriota bacterium]|nr:hypothetical protein [Acidobacteriota bacterium]